MKSPDGKQMMGAALAKRRGGSAAIGELSNLLQRQGGGGGGSFGRVGADVRSKFSLSSMALSKFK